MKILKLVVTVLDFDQLGAAEIKDVIEKTRYPNRCISPRVLSVEERDIVAWCDEHPLNDTRISDEALLAIFDKL